MISSAKRILVPVDFSDCSKNALHYAAFIAEKLGAKIILLHALEPPFNFPAHIDGALDYLKKNAHKHLERMIDELESSVESKQLKIEKELVIGKTVTEIIRWIKSEEPDLVITGSGTEMRGRKMIFGSVSTDMLLKSPVPVLTVPENFAIGDFKKILFTTNYKRNDLENLKSVSDFAKEFDGSVQIVHVSIKDDLESQIKFRGFKDLISEEKDLKNTDFKLIIDSDPFDAISELVDKEGASMIVLNRYSKNVFEKLLYKDHTKQLGVYAKTPMLVIPSK